MDTGTRVDVSYRLRLWVRIFTFGIPWLGPLSVIFHNPIGGLLVGVMGAAMFWLQARLFSFVELGSTERLLREALPPRPTIPKAPVGFYRTEPSRMS